ncbi:MAG: dipeptidase [Bacillota bacterium]
MPIVDGHADTLTRLVREGRSLREASDRGHSDLPRLLRAGVSLQVLAICPEEENGPEAGLCDVLVCLDRFHRECAEAPEAFPVLTRSDLERLGPGRVGFLLALEGAGPLCGRPGLLRILFRLGVRMVGLTWNGRNAFADGVGVEGGGGLTGAGRALVALAEELGMVLDLAHLNEAGFWEVLAMASRPPVVSHANARAVCDHPRNLSDEQARAVAARGGIVGINLYPAFLSSQGSASLADVLRHLEHFLATVGPHAVGFGLDYDGIEVTPVDLPDITSLPRLVAALGRLGLDEAARRAILGENWLRVFRQILP